MIKYHYAKVQFERGHRTYSANCPPDTEIDSKVVVRLNWETPSLANATVMSRGSTDTPCRHSIVCSQSDAAKYGTGPDSVQDAGGLERFMAIYGYIHLETVCVDEAGHQLVDQIWSDCYGRGGPISGNDTCVFSPNKMTVFSGSQGVGKRIADDYDFFGLDSWYRVILDPQDCEGIVSHPHLTDNVFRDIARLIEGDLVWPFKIGCDQSLISVPY